MFGPEIRFPIQSKRENLQGFSLFFCMPVHEKLGTCDLKAPLPGVGGICQNSRKRSRAAQVRVPFSAPKQEGRIQKVLSSFAYRNRKADIDNLRMHVQGGDMADTASHRRTYTQHRPPFSLQRSETEQSESIFLNMHVFIASSPDLLLPLQHSRHIHPHPGRVSSSRTSTSTL